MRFIDRARFVVEAVTAARKMRIQEATIKTETEKRNAEIAAERKSGIIRHGRFGTVLAYDPDVVSDKISERILSGDYEGSEIDIAKRVLQATDRVVELGAGLGFVATTINALVCPTSYCAVEADPRMAHMAKRTLVANGMDPAIILNCAATSDAGQLERGCILFEQSEDFWASKIVDQPNDRTVSVPVQSLNELLRAQQATALICDIEGAEVSALRNADLSGIRILMLEVHPLNVSPAEMRALFTRVHAEGLTFDAWNSWHQMVTFQRFD